MKRKSRQTKASVPAAADSSPNDNQGRTFLYLSERPDLLDVALEDGTNVPAGTDFVYTERIGSNCINLQEHRGTKAWNDRASRLLSDFRAFRQKCVPVSVIVEQRRFPSAGENGRSIDFTYNHMLFGGSGPLVGPAYLQDPKSGRGIAGAFSFLDVNSKLIANPNGAPVGLRLGLSRMFAFLEQPRAVHDDRTLLTAQLHELCREAGELITQVPGTAIASIWSSWGSLLPLASASEYVWCDALFEFSWAEKRGVSRVRRAVFDESGNYSQELIGNGRFPRLHSVVFGDRVLAHDFPSEGGYPFSWSSKIDDVAAQSINLIEFLLAHEWPTEPAPPAAKPGRPKGASTKKLVAGKVPKFGRPKNLGVSYAWGDKTSKTARERERLVDECCKKCQQWGYHVIRDKRQLRYGDLLSKFIQRMTRTSRVLVIFSAKYLKSRACILELHAIYRRARSEPKAFQNRVIPLVLGDANIDTPTERAAHVRYWKGQLKELEAEVDHLGGRDLEYLEQLRTLVTEISKMLSFVSEIWSPRGFRAIRRNGYEALQELLKGD